MKDMVRRKLALWLVLILVINAFAGFYGFGESAAEGKVF